MQQTVPSWRPVYWVTAIAAVCALITLVIFSLQRPVHAAGESERVVTIYDNDQETTFITSAKTVGEALGRGGVELGTGDSTEPSLNTELVAKNYNVNIYRARPVVVIDGDGKTTITTSQKSSREIVENAGIHLYSEDLAPIERVDDVLVDGTAAQKITVDRATPFALVLYGDEGVARTQATTVAGILEEKDINLEESDKTSLSLDTPVKEGMTLKIWREGKQTITVNEKIDFPVKQIPDPNREVGYREVQTSGEYGEKTVVYEILIRNGEEVSRKQIQSVVKVQPKQQIEIVGAKPSFSGDFAEALAKLRSCEGGYDSWNSAGPYYGAYQFDETTWAGAAPAGAEYGNATSAEQDQAARNLYERRGWQPWPSCGANLPDIYR
jgi:uncharacterized protein YabE (DUF348 family)